MITKAYNFIGFLVAISVVLLSLFALTATAQPAPTINYQGKLTDSSGVAVADGTYNMRFYIYNSLGAATTSALWTEELTGGDQVQVTNGLFSVMLGSTTALTSLDFNQPLFLGVEIGGTGAPAWDGEMSPRKELGTVPAAFEAYQLGGVASSSFLRSDQADTASGLLTFSGGLVALSSSTITNLTAGTATATTLVINNESFTDLTGTGLSNNSGILSVSTSTLGLGDGTFTGLSDTQGSLTANRLIFTNSGGTALTDSANLTFDGTSLSLGINSYIGWGGTNYLYASSTNDSLVFGENAGTNFNSGTLNNIAIGQNALVGSSTLIANTGDRNIAIGLDALRFNESGSDNNAIGDSALENNISGSNNNAFGRSALISNTTGSDNIAFGNGALISNTTGSDNTALGFRALRYYATANDNFAAGEEALQGSSTITANTGNDNVAIGYRSLLNNASGYSNIALGIFALNDNTTGYENIALNGYSMTSNTTGNNNTALGVLALDGNTTGSNNIAIGRGSLQNNNGSDNIVFGRATADNTLTVDRGIFIGSNIDAASTTEDDVLNIGNIIFGQNIDGTGTILSSGNIGIGTSTPYAKFTVAGDIALTGGLYDSNASLGTNGQILQSDGTNASWISTSTLGLGDGTFTGLSDTQGSLTANRLIFTNSGGTALTDSANLTFDGSTFVSTGTTTLGSGGNTANISTDGVLTFSGTGVYSVANDAYVFRSTSAPLAGLVFNGSSFGVDIKDISGATVNRIGIEGTDSFFTSGNTGIGTTTPNAKLTVAGDINIDGDYSIAWKGTDFLYASSSIDSIAFGESAGANFSDATIRSVAIGSNALSNYATSGPSFNGESVAVGVSALSTNYNGAMNTAVGHEAMLGSFSSSAGYGNVAVGRHAIRVIREGLENVGIGASSLSLLRDGDYNVAVGHAALTGIENSSANTALGYQAGVGSGSNYRSVSDSFSTFVGYYASRDSTVASTTSLTNVNAFGAYATAGCDNCFALGASSTNAYAVRVGIGSSTPSSQLTIEGIDGVNPLTIASSSGDTLVKVEETGYVGIGTDSPASALYISGDQNVDAGSNAITLNQEGTDAFSNASIFFTRDSKAAGRAMGSITFDTAARINSFADSGDVDAGFLSFYTNGPGGTSYQEVMRLTSGEDVGIGTTTPYAKLTVAGDIALTGGLYDSSASLGAGGMVLQTTGSGVQWVATSTLGLGGGSGATAFTGLTDTQGSLTANRLIFTNSGGTALTDSSELLFDGTTLVVATSSAVANYGFTVGNEGAGAIYADGDIQLAEGHRLNISGYGSVARVYDGQFSANLYYGSGAGSLQTGTSSGNTALGNSALDAITEGSNNNSFGGFSLTSVTTGDSNSMFGNQAGFAVTTGSDNVGMGASVLSSLTTGDDNVALGTSAGRGLIDGANNTYIGTGAGRFSTSSDSNVGVGRSTAQYLSGDFNTALGREALFGGGFAEYVAHNNTAIGYQAGYNATTSANNNILLGYQAASNLTSGSNNIVIGYDVDLQAATDSNTLNIGNLIFGTGIDGTGDSLSSGNIGIGTTTPYAKFTVAGDIALTGGLYDSNASLGTNGYVLQSDGTNVNWVATSSLGIAGGGGGVTDFVSLTDTQGSLTADRIIFTNSGGTALTDSSDLLFDGTGLAIGTSTLAPARALTLADQGAGSLYAEGNIDAGSYSLNGWGSGLRFYSGQFADHFFVGSSAGSLETGTSSGNTAVGFNVLTAITSGSSNTGQGSAALTNVTSGDANSAFGRTALFALTTGSRNTAFGQGALAALTSGDENNAIGNAAGVSLLTGSGNNFIGYDAGRNATSSSFNVLIGDEAGYFLGGDFNVAIGAGSLNGNLSQNALYVANNNTALGYHAGYNATTSANNNILIGYQAADNISSGTNNIVIGYDVDLQSPTDSNILNIGNLIFGTSIDGTGTATSSGNIGIGTTTPSAKLTVEGAIQATNLLGGAVNLTTDASGNIIRDPSDVRLKTNITTIDGALDKVLDLRGVSYQWIDQDRFGDQTEIGFIAQELDEVLPEVVRKGGEYWSVNTRNILGVVVEAIKELYQTVTNNQSRVAELEDRVQYLEELLQGQATSSVASTVVSETEESEEEASTNGSSGSTQTEPESVSEGTATTTSSSTVPAENNTSESAEEAESNNATSTDEVVDEIIEDNEPETVEEEILDEVEEEITSEEEVEETTTEPEDPVEETEPESSTAEVEGSVPENGT